MTEEGRFTTYKEGCQAFRQWQKKHKNPLDLENILHNENIRIKDNDSGRLFYVNIKAMEEYSIIFKGRIAFVGVTIRGGKYFDVITYEEQEEIKKSLDEKLKTLAERYNCIY
jgi:hypothetical protein